MLPTLPAIQPAVPLRWRCRYLLLTQYNTLLTAAPIKPSSLSCRRPRRATYQHYAVAQPAVTHSSHCISPANQALPRTR